MAAKPKVLLVTGANQGLGLSIIHIASQREPESIYILCSRSLPNGHSALQKLRELGVKSQVEVVKLDVCDGEDVEGAVRFVEERWGYLDVLINNAGISPLAHPPNDPDSVKDVREAYMALLGTNMISPFVISRTFLPLLHKSPRQDPKIVNITSGLGSMEFNLRAEMVRGHRSIEYGSSKVGLNGITAHMQAVENDRAGVIWEEGSGWSEPNAEIAAKISGAGKEERFKEEGGYVRFYTCQPGILKTAFNGFKYGKTPDEGAEVVVRLLVDGQGGNSYPGGTYWKCDVDVMEEVPW